MKKHTTFIALALLLTSCIEQSKIEEPSVRWNGYFHFLKSGEVMHTLWAGQNINIGTVTYGINEDANFYVTYDCSASGWMISETHLFAGDKAQMPLNKPGAPKIGLFPYAQLHQPTVSTITYEIPLAQLPPCANPGFVVAAHCVASSPYGQTETAWAEGNYTFSDKGWGWYDTYYYDPPMNPSTILYGTAYTLDSLLLYLVDLNTGFSELILSEYVGNTPGTYDGAAYDSETGRFFFTRYPTGELWVNTLTADDPSSPCGSLSGISGSGTYYDDSYYYVDEISNTLKQVIFSPGNAILSETILDTIPWTLAVNDIAMGPDGEYLYMAGTISGGQTELLTWDTGTGTFYSTSVSLGEDVQIAFGSDGKLYALAPYGSSGTTNIIYTITLEEGMLTEISGGEIIIIDDQFTDLSMGPVM